MSAIHRPQGFAAMSPERQRELASLGGRARSTAHKARAAARLARRTELFQSLGLSLSANNPSAPAAQPDGR